MISMQGINIHSGAFEFEEDRRGQFQWLSENVVFETTRVAGRLVIAGECPVRSSISVNTGDLDFLVEISRGAARIIIPLTEESTHNSITLSFSGHQAVADDDRVLCFKARQIDFIAAASENEPTGQTTFGREPTVADYRQLTVFPLGWLRMSAQSTGKKILKISGILSPPLHRREVMQLTANGRPIESITYGLSNPDYSFLGSIAFEGELELSEFEGDDVIRFASTFISDNTPATPFYHDWFWPLKDQFFPMPALEHMQRIGATDPNWFRFSGATFVNKLEEIVPRSNFASMDVLDWGSGCGRLTRHLLSQGFKSVSGFDIDPINIAWCNSNLPDAQFYQVDVNNLSGLPGGFDLIVGHSVFTHLTEADQYIWLAKLNSLLKPGGMAIVTIMGSTSAILEGMEFERYCSLQKTGFWDCGWQEDGVDMLSPGYYRRIFHTFDYVLKNWPGFLEVAAIMDGFSDHQAAVVLRKSSLND